MKVSACVIVKNEEVNIVKWLQNMKRIVDEMIVVDTGSSDRTIFLATESGATVYSYPWRGDFSEAKNFALEKASGDWILFLDADEYFSERSIEILPGYLNKIHSNVLIDALVCAIVNIDMDQDNKVITLSQNIRIFRNNESLRYHGKVHETLLNKNRNLQFTYANEEFEIIHTGYSSRVIKEKLERNLKLLKDDIEENGEAACHYEYLADCYYGLKDYDKVIEYARKAIASGNVILGREGTIYRYLIEATALSGAGIDEVFSVIEMAIGKFPDYPEFVLKKAEILILQGDDFTAEEHLMNVLVLQAKQKEKKGLGELKEVSGLYAKIGQLFQRKGDFDQALIYYKRALAENRYQEDIFKGFYELLREYDVVDVIEILQTIYKSGKKDLQFLVYNLKHYPLDKIYLYYAQQLHLKYNEALDDDVLLPALLLQKSYMDVVEKESYILQSLYDGLFISAIKEHDDMKCSIVKSMFPKAYISLLEKIFNEDKELSRDERKIYERINLL